MAKPSDLQSTTEEQKANAAAAVAATAKHAKQIQSLYLSALVFASVAMLGKLMGAAGLSAFDPVKILSAALGGGNTLSVTDRAKSSMRARGAAIITTLLDSLLSLSVLLLCVAVALQNGIFPKYHSQ